MPPMKPADPGSRNRKVSIATIYRWLTKGVRGAKLETMVMGKARFTSKEAIERFLIAQNPIADQLTAMGV